MNSFPGDAPTIAYCAFHCRCPRCGTGKAYDGMLTLAQTCGSCGLPIRELGQGDGPASLSILIVGGLASIFASILEVLYEPPYWLHAVLWIPFVLIGTIYSLRWIKAGLVALQYRLKSPEA